LDGQPVLCLENKQPSADVGGMVNRGEGKCRDENESYSLHAGFRCFIVSQGFVEIGGRTLRRSANGRSKKSYCIISAKVLNN
jgi:hypothetical protein